MADNTGMMAGPATLDDVVIDEPGIVPICYFVQVTELRPDLARILRDLLRGRAIPGCRLRQRDPAEGDPS